MHLIDTSNNRNNMAYVGKTPWHGLGERLEDGASLDQWRIAAGLDWTIEKAPVFFRPTNTEEGLDYPQFKVQKVDNRSVLYRSDTKAMLSIMSDNRYNIVQPGDCLEFFRDLVETHKSYSIETAGALDGGKRVWALARYNAELDMAGDIIKPYLLLATSCDGTMATVGQFTTVRVVCQNTLSFSLSNDKSSSVRVPHSRTFNAEEVHLELDTMAGRFEGFSSNADLLATKAIEDSTAVNYFAKLYAKTDKQGNVTNEKQLEKVVNKLMRLYKKGPGAELVSSMGTQWGALNAVTRYVDHNTRAHNNNNRFVSGQFGAGSNLKTKAYELALAA